MPKQYVPLGHGTSIGLAIQAFLRVDAVHAIVPVIHPSDGQLYEDATSEVHDPRLCPPVSGGASRAKSVRLGLESLKDDPPDCVLIHDAARPFVSQTIVQSVIQALDTHEGACAALPVVDALWTSKSGRAIESVPRDGLWRAQTPQGFRYEAILKAHQGHDGSGADDVAVGRQAGLQVAFVLGSEQNYKITTKADLERVRAEISREQDKRLVSFQAASAARPAKSGQR